MTDLNAMEVKLQGVGYGNPWKSTETIDTLVTSYTAMSEKAHVGHDERRVTKRARVIASQLRTLFSIPSSSTFFI